MTMTAQTIDFRSSFLWWRVDSRKRPPRMSTHPPPLTLNNARVPLDCLCTVTERRTGARQELALGVSCKTERVGVAADIWPLPNADFKPVMSAERFLGIKTYDVAGRQIPLYPPSLGMQPERQVTVKAEAFDRARTDVIRVAAEPLPTAAAVVQAVLANRVLTARTAYRSDRYEVVLEYPMKTINANERDTVFQPDTGPVLVPDLGREPADLIEGVELAYIAYNRFDHVELILREPVAVADGARVYHYNRPLKLDGRNELFALS